MVAVNNLEGQVFGSLTVVARSPSDTQGRACWLCRCVCMDLVVRRGKDLLLGKSTRCKSRCLQKEDFSGLRIGNIEIVKPTNVNDFGNRMYEVVCLNVLKDKTICNKRWEISSTQLKKEIKNPMERKVPKCCQKCARVLCGQFKKNNNRITK